MFAKQRFPTKPHALDLLWRQQTAGPVTSLKHLVTNRVVCRGMPGTGCCGEPIVELHESCRYSTERMGLRQQMRYACSKKHWLQRNCVNIQKFSSGGPPPEENLSLPKHSKIFFGRWTQIHKVNSNSGQAMKSTFLTPHRCCTSSFAPVHAHGSFQGAATDS